MRGPLKYLALLFLVPFLACTDTPAEPDTVEAYFAGQGPTKPDPGNYIKFVIQCPHSDAYLFIVWGPASDDAVRCHDRKGYVVAGYDPTLLKWQLQGDTDCDGDELEVYHSEVLKWTPPPECGDAAEEVTVKFEYVTIY